MEVSLIAWALVALVGGVLLGVVISSFVRRDVVDDDTPDVVELARAVQKLQKQVKGAVMSRVRAGSSDAAEPQVAADSPAAMDSDAPPELRPVASAPVVKLKDQLRAIAYGGRK